MKPGSRERQREKRNVIQLPNTGIQTCAYEEP